jgi:luciferase family oxidoreductase group 1
VGDERQGGRAGIHGTVRGSAPVPLSVLDLATVGSGFTATDALRTSVEIARTAETRGYHRMWVAEHHSMPGVASSSPAVILAHLAAHTRTLRLGSGGVMLPNHAPLVIAEQFGTLEALAPGRIDLGLGRAPGTDGATAAALRRTDRLHEGADEFPQQLAELTRFLDDDFPDAHRYARIHAIPGPVQGTSPGGVQSPGRPSIWLLGSSGFSARLARSACPSRSRTTSRPPTPFPRWPFTASPSGRRRSWTAPTPPSASPRWPPTTRSRPAVRCSPAR